MAKWSLANNNVARFVSFSPFLLLFVVAAAAAEAGFFRFVSFRFWLVRSLSSLPSSLEEDRSSLVSPLALALFSSLSPSGCLALVETTTLAAVLNNARQMERKKPPSDRENHLRVASCDLQFVWSLRRFPVPSAKDFSLYFERVKGGERTANELEAKAVGE